MSNGINFRKLAVDLRQELTACQKERDEGLARETVMQKQLGELWAEISATRESLEVHQQRLAEAHDLLTFVKKCLVKNGEYAPLSHYEIDKVLGIGGFASPGCADGEKAE